MKKFPKEHAYMSMFVSRPMWGMIPVRITFGTILLTQGIGRLIHMHGAYGSIIEQLPGPFAAVLFVFFSVIEILGGAMIIPGLCSRLVGFAVLIEMIISIFTERIPLGFHGDVRLDMLVLAVAGMIFFSGGGRFSLDRLIAKHLLRLHPSKKWEHYLIAETPYCEHWYE